VRPLHRGLAIAALHVALVGSLGAKLLLDRQTLPRAWAPTLAYDPDLPIRGRYVALQLVVDTEGFPAPRTYADLGPRRTGAQDRARLAVRDGRLVAVHDDAGRARVWFTLAPGTPWPSFHDANEARTTPLAAPPVGVLEDRVPYFVPEGARLPVPRRDAGERMWAEVSVPPHGAPRPIRLALERDGVRTLLDVR
jgi:hypothetical protein